MKIFINLSEVDQKLSNHIGLALRAGKVFVGEKLQELIGKNKIYLIVMANDSADSFKKSLPKNMPTIIYLSQDQLAALINKYGKRINGFGIADKNLAKLIINRFNDMEGECNEKE